MQKKLTISINENVYRGLHKVVGRGNISRFIEDLLRPHVINEKFEAGYEEMSRDEKRESEALEWSEATVGDVSDEPR